MKLHGSGECTISHRYPAGVIGPKCNYRETAPEPMMCEEGAEYYLCSSPSGAGTKSCGMHNPLLHPDHLCPKHLAIGLLLGLVR